VEDSVVTLQVVPEIESVINELVERGDFPDATAVLGEALRLLQERIQLAELNESIDAGLYQLDRGEGVTLSESVSRDRLRIAAHRFRNGEQPKPSVCPPD
jgi:Arc/MetJ-type ribon-helix-helix transcriptional regulator